VSLKHPDGYLEQSTLRFNRRRAGWMTLGAMRLLGIAMATPPRPFWKIVGHPCTQEKARLAAAT
jgi:hypothetical protein